jgi:hypothetical protein
MNQLKKQLLCLAAVVSTVPLHGALNTTTNIVPRSQSFNAARQLVGWDNSTWGIFRKADDDRYFTSFNLTFAYNQTFRNNRLTTALFGDDLVCAGCDNDLAINVSGSTVPSRGANDWLADYFGLPADFQSTVTFNPKISNFVLDFNIYTGLDAWNEGLYFWIYAPFVHTKWNLNATECIGTAAYSSFDSALAALGEAYPAGYFSSAAVSAGNTTASFLDWANGATPSINPAYNEDENVVWQPLCCSRMINSCDCACDDGFVNNGFGEIRMILGKNFFGEKENDCHLGVGVYAAAPTGTRVGHSRYLFEPIVGNGKHWELGGQITGHHICWRSEDDNRSFGVYFEANITHLFGAQQTRCFDLCSAGSSSRYMLAQKMEYFGPEATLGAAKPVTLNPISSDSASLQFANEFAPVANITRRQITSTIGAQGDLAISFAYQAKNFQWDLGYNFWGRSCEEIRISNDCCPVIMEPWALKGTAFVYGFEHTTQLPVPLAASDSTATIHNGSNDITTVGTTTARINVGCDNSVLAHDSKGFFPGTQLFAQPVGGGVIYTSNTPVLISEADFNLTGTRGISNKLFTHLNWAWDHCNEGKWSPYVGVGAEVEFGGGHKGPECTNSCSSTCYNPCKTSCKTSCDTSCNTSCDTSCDTSCNPCSYPTSTPTCSTLKTCCSNVALTQWGVWFKVGSSYN